MQKKLKEIARFVDGELMLPDRIPHPKGIDKTAIVIDREDKIKELESAKTKNH